MKNKFNLYKNKISLFLSILFLFQVVLFNTNNTVFAATTPSVSYTVTGETRIGNTIEIAVNISNVTDLYGGSIDFVYDTSLLEIQSVTKGNIFGSNEVLTPLGANGKIESGQASFAVSMKGIKPGVTTNNGTLAIIKAKILKEGTVNLKTTSDNSSLSLSGFTTRVKLSSSLPSKIDYSTEDKIITLNNTIPLTAGKYEETNTNISYIGSWNPQNHSSYSGGSAMLSNKPGDSITFQFNGTGIKLYSYASSICGISKITIDNEVFTIDNFSSIATPNKLIVDKKGLTYGNHTVTIEVSNTKNPASRDYNFVLDKFEIIN
ncbi:cohesin domain-containing protein [Clostridium sartagoforme]|uniref:cohesin domain-containing protein n=1 Tax=Clostridium sartagoforme TaxID=84031 RepID=UPI0031E3F861